MISLTAAIARISLIAMIANIYGPNILTALIVLVDLIAMITM